MQGLLVLQRGLSKERLAGTQEDVCKSSTSSSVQYREIYAAAASRNA